jgi:hypothetical protein
MEAVCSAEAVSLGGIEALGAVKWEKSIVAQHGNSMTTWRRGILLHRRKGIG